MRFLVSCFLCVATFEANVVVLCTEGLRPSVTILCCLFETYIEIVR